MNQTTTEVDRLRKNLNSRFDSTTAGMLILQSVIVLSGILSAVFFWRHSATVFSGIPPVLATALGLAIGIVPSEGAIFGWKRIRATKKDMTTQQLKASDWGIWFSAGFAVTNVVAIFVSSFSEIPESIRQLSAWITFFALMLPIPTQLLLLVKFMVNEQSVVENHAQAKLSAMAHAAYIEGEEARIGAILEGRMAALNAALAGYGSEAGRAEADRMLRDGQRDIIGQFYGGQQPPRTDRPELPAFTDDELLRIAAAVAAMSNSTHDAPRQDVPQVIPLATPEPGQGGNGPSGRKLGGVAADPSGRNFQ